MKFERALTSEDLLATMAATEHPRSALDKWNEICIQRDFDQISDNTQRLAPAIYANLRDEGPYRERARLKGTYRHHWARNVRMLADVQPIIAEFNTQGIDYRVIKGTAIQLFTDRLGARIMGDIDIVISLKNVDKARGVIEKHGFRSSSISDCGIHPEGNEQSALNFNKGQSHIDLHIAEMKSPSSLYLRMLLDEPMWCSVKAVEWKIPQPELMFLNAAQHGYLCSSATDYIQSVVDMKILSQFVNPESLIVRARKTGTLRAFKYLKKELLSAELIDTASEPNRLSYFIAVKYQSLKEIIRTSVGSRTLVAQWKVRHLGHQQHVNIRLQGVRVPRKYLLWLKLGKFAALERSGFSRLGGFLKPPEKTFGLDYSMHPFDLKNSEIISANPVIAREASDWRFGMSFPTGVSDVRLLLHSDAFDTHDFVLCINGKFVTTIVAQDSSLRDVTLRKVSGYSEVSLRPVLRSCEYCAPDLSDLEIRLVKIF